MVDRPPQPSKAHIRGWVPLIIVISGGIMLAMPSDTPMANRIEMFRVLAEVGAALVGFVGIVGIFGLDAVRSAIADNNNAILNLQIQSRSVGDDAVWDLQVMALESRIKQLKGHMESSLKDLFMTIATFMVLIVSAVLGLSGVGPDWRFYLFFCFISLFAGTYALYIVTRTTTTVAD